MDFAAALGVASAFSCELGGSKASLEGTGVESLLEDRAFGKKLAFVVSWRQGSEATFGFVFGDGAEPGDDF